MPKLLCLALTSGLLLLACGEDKESPDRGSGAGGSSSICTEDADCADGLFCNGVELCDVSDEDSDSQCEAGESPCQAGQICLEESTSCQTNCEETEDADEDGRIAVECGGDDCDDSDPATYPGNVEVCDLQGHDEDCDPETFGFLDNDEDEFVDARCCNEVEGGEQNCGLDCNDSRRNVNPNASEVCDYFDNNCDGAVDEDLQQMGFFDRDGDQFGDPLAEASGCPGDSGFSETAGDCDDTNPQINSGLGEACDGIDNDCDLSTTDALDASEQPWYVDADSDGYGELYSAPVVSCQEPKQAGVSFSLAGLDCLDSNANVHPGAEELCNARDDDCDGQADFVVGAGDFEDDDGDGAADAACGGTDCDDLDWRTRPGAPEIADGRDNDCDGEIDEDVTPTVWFEDADGDGYGDPAVAQSSPTQPPGYVLRAGDCLPLDPTGFPGASEVCDNIDNDCDGESDEGLTLQLFPDADGDGYGNSQASPVVACEVLEGLVNDASDCNDADATVRPGAPELCAGADIVDSDCDQRIDDPVCGYSPRLSFLKVQGGKLTPAFRPQTTTYTLQVDFTWPGAYLTPYCLGLDGGTCATIAGNARGDGSASALVEDDFTIEGPDGAVYTVTVQRTPCQLEKLAISGSPGPSFGDRMDADGKILVVGARQATASSQAQAGKVFVYSVPSTGAVTLMTELTAPVAGSGDAFGAGLATCGSNVFVGAPNDDAAFDAPLTDNSGTNVGAVHVYTRSPTGYSYVRSVRPESGRSSWGQVVQCDAETFSLLAGQERFLRLYDAPYQSVSAVLDVNASRFGETAALHGNRFVIGAQWFGNAYPGTNNGQVYFYNRQGPGTPVQALNTDDGFDHGINDNFGRAVGLHGNRAAVAVADDSYASGVFTGDPGPGSGPAPSPCGGGDYSDFGGVQTYFSSGGNFNFTHYIGSPDPGCGDNFGYQLAMQEDLLFISAEGESTEGSGVSFSPPQNDIGVSRSGGVYLYRFIGGTWRFIAHIKTPAPVESERLGRQLTASNRFVAMAPVAPPEGEDGAVWLCRW